jgi:GNAT superfamily N-acetyltransferase
MAEPTDNQFEYKPLGESYDKPPTKEAIPGVTIPKSTSTLPDSGNAGGLASSSPSTPQYDYKPLTESYDKPPTPSSQSGSTLPSQKSQKTLPPEKPGIFKQAWEGTKEVGRGLARGITQAQGMAYSMMEAPLTEMEQHGQTLPKSTGPDYDMEGYIKKYGQPDQSKGQHLTDEFKNPSHITFSKESKYSNPEQEGGEWKYLDPNGNPMEEKTPGGQWHFYASPYNISQHSAKDLQDYFRTQEPKSVLHLPEDSFATKLKKNFESTREAIAGMEKSEGIQPTEYSEFTKHPISASLAGGAQALPQMIIPAVASALGGPMAGEVSAGLLFGGAFYQEAYDKVLRAQLAQGMPEDKAKEKAHYSALAAGAVGATGGAFMQKAAGLTSNIFRHAIGKGAVTSAEILAEAAGKDSALTAVKNFGKGMLMGGITMAGYNVGETAVERYIGGLTGPDEPTLWESAKGVFPAAVGLSIIQGMFGIAVRVKPMTDVNVNPRTRAAHAFAVADALQKVDPKMAEAFRLNAIIAIQNKQPIDLTPKSLEMPYKEQAEAGQEPSTETLQLTPDQRALQQGQFYNEPLGSPEQILEQGKRAEHKKVEDAWNKAVAGMGPDAPQPPKLLPSPEDVAPKPKDIPQTEPVDLLVPGREKTADAWADVKVRLDQAQSQRGQTVMPMGDGKPPTDGSAGAPTDLTMPTPAPTTPQAPETPQKPSGETLPPSVKQQTPEDIVKQTLQDEMSRPEVPAEQEPTAQPVAEPPVEAPVAPEVPVAPEPSPEPSAPKVSDKEKRVKAIDKSIDNLQKKIDSKIQEGYSAGRDKADIEAGASIRGMNDRIAKLRKEKSELSGEPSVPEKPVEEKPEEEKTKLPLTFKESNYFGGKREAGVTTTPGAVQIVATMKDASGKTVEAGRIWVKPPKGKTSLDEDNKTGFFVGNIFTNEDFRAKGIGTQLMDEAIRRFGPRLGSTKKSDLGEKFVAGYNKKKGITKPDEEYDKEQTAQVKKEEVTPPVSEPSAPVEPKVEVTPESPAPKEEAPSKPMTLDEADDYARKAGYLVGDERLNPDMLSEVQEAIENDKIGMKPANSDIMGIINNAKVKTEEPAGQPRVETATEPETAPAKEEQTAQKGEKLEGVTSKGGDISIGSKLQFVEFPYDKYTVVGQDPVSDTERENGEFFVKVVKDGETKPENMLATDLMPIPETKKETAQKEEPKKSTKVSTMRSLIASGVTELSDADIDNLYEWQKGEFTGKSKADVRKVFANLLAKTEPKKKESVAEPKPTTVLPKEEKPEREGGTEGMKIVLSTKEKDKLIEGEAEEVRPVAKELTAQETTVPTDFDSLPKDIRDEFDTALASKNFKDMFRLLSAGTNTGLLNKEFSARTGIKIKKDEHPQVTIENIRKELKSWAGEPTAQETKAPTDFDSLPEGTKNLFNKAFEDKNVGDMSMLIFDRNPLLQEEFTKRTGIQIPKTLFALRAALATWRAEKPAQEETPKPAEPAKPKTGATKTTRAAFDSLPQATQKRFKTALESRNSDNMVQSLNDKLHADVLRAEFENQTGIELPKSAIKRKQSIEKWSSEKPIEKPAIGTMTLEQKRERVAEINKEVEAIRKSYSRKRSAKAIDELNDKVRPLYDELTPLQKDIRNTILHETVEQGDEANRMSAQELLDNNAVSKKTYDAIRRMVKSEIKSYGKIDDDIASQAEDSVTELITTVPKSNDANSLKKLVLNQLINRSDDALSEKMNDTHDMSRESIDSLKEKFNERANKIVSRATPQEDKVKLYAELLNDVDKERERLIEEDKKKSEQEQITERKRDKAKEALASRKHEPTPTSGESDIDIMSKKPQEFTVPESSTKLKEEFEAGKWLHVTSHGEPAPFTKIKEGQTEERSLNYDAIWKSLEGGTVKKQKGGIRVESKKERKPDGELKPTIYHDFIPIDTTPQEGKLSEREGVTLVGSNKAFGGRVGETRKIMRDIAKADPDFAKNPRFTVSLADKDDPKAGAVLVYKVDNRQYKIIPSAISEALDTMINDGEIKDGQIIGLSPGYLQANIDEGLFAVKKGADRGALFSLKDTDFISKIFDKTYGENIRIPSAINKLQDMAKRGIISEDESKRSIELLNGYDRKVMPKSAVLDMLRKETGYVDTGTAGRSSGIEGTIREGNALPETQVPSATPKEVAGDIQDQRAKAGGRALRMGGEDEGMGEGYGETLPVLSDTGQVEKDVADLRREIGRGMGQGNKMLDSIRTNDGQDIQDISDLQNRTKNKNIEPAREITPVQDSISSLLSRAFGKRIIWIQDNKNFDGVVIDENRIYLSSHLADPQSIMKTFGHELYHSIKNEGVTSKKDIPLTSKKFERDIRAAIPKDTFERFSRWRNEQNRKLLGIEQGEDKLWEEYGGYVLGDAIRDPRFYDNLQRQSTSSFKKFIDWMVDAFRKMGLISDKEVASAYYAPDKAERLIKSASDLLTTYLENKTGESKTPTIGEPKYLFAGRRATGAFEAKATGQYSDILDKRVRSEIDDSKAELQFKEGRNHYLLGDVLKHDELFKSYPDAKNLLTTIVIDPTREPYGQYNEATPDTKEHVGKEPEIKVVAKTENEAKQTLLHEIQHMIQDNEGFAKGGTPYAMSGEAPELAPLRGKAYGLLKQIDDVKEKPDYAGKSEELKRLGDEWQETMNQVQSIRQTAQHKEYRQLAGEEEARRVSSRADMTESERMGNPYERTDLTPDEKRVARTDSQVRFALFSHDFDPNNPPDIKDKDIVEHATNPLEKTMHTFMPGFDIVKGIGKGISQFGKTLIAPTTKSPEHVKVAQQLSKEIGARHRREDIASAKIDGKLGKFDNPAKYPSGFFNKIGVGDATIPIEKNPSTLFESDMSQGRIGKMTNAEINKRYGTTGLQANMIRKAEEVTNESFEEARQALQDAGVPLETIRQFYFPGLHTKDSIRAFNQAMEEHIEEHPGEPKPLADWSKEEKDAIKNRVNELLKDKKGSDTDHLQYLSRHQLYGKETFKNQKVFDDIMTAREFGLQAISPNPMDSVKLKLAEINTSVVGHAYMNNTARPQGDVKFLKTGKEMPEDWAQLNGRVGIVYGPPTMKTSEFVDRNVYESLLNVANALGIQHERKYSAGRGKLGWATREEGGKIVTQFATELSVMAHEVGHKLDTKYDLWDKLVAGAEGVGKRGKVTKEASAEKRATIQDELRALADLSWEGSEASPAYKKQVRKKEEKMAHLLEAYIHAKDRFEEVAPTVFKDFDSFIKSTPELSELAEIRQGLALKELKGEKHLGGFPVVGYMIAKKPVAEILNNYMSSSLYNNKLLGDAFKGTMACSNVLNQSQLSVGSFFHVGFTAAETTVVANSNVIQDVYGVIKGNRTLSDLGGSLSRVPMAMIKTPMDGSKMLAEWQNPTVEVPINVPVNQLKNPIAIVAKAAELAGGGFRLEQGLKTEQTDKMLRDWYGKNKLRAAMRSPVAFLELSAKPIMEWLVPKQKAGVFGYKVQRLIEMNPEKTLQELIPELRSVWNFVDASMGMVRYDRLFLNNQAKNVVQGTVRAPGWSGGTIAQIGGGLKDTAKFFAEWTKTGKMPDKLPDRTAYTISLLLTAAAINGALTYAFTGATDTSIDSMDWWAFRTGENDEQGRPIRFLLPTYAKDIFAYWRHPGKTLLAKTHPMLGALSDVLIRNADYYGVEIRHKGDNPLAQAGEVGMYAIKQFEPFWMRGLEKETQAEGQPDTLAGIASTVAKNPLKALGPELGVMPASAEYLNTPAQNTMRDILQARTPKSEKTQAQADIYTLKRQLRGRLQQTGDTEPIYQAVEDGKITSKEARDLIKSKNVPPLVREFKQLTPEEAITVYEVANEKEKAELKPLLNKKMRTALKNKTPDARKRILALYNEVMESEGEKTT